MDQGGGVYWSPTVGASVAVPGATVQVSWANAFAPPSLADQFFQPGVLAQPNPDLEPERVRNDWQLQLASKPLRIGRTTANGTVSLFRADIDGMILWFPNFRYVWSPGNYDVRRRGAELGAAVNLPVADMALAGNVSDVAVEYRGPVLSGQVAYRPRYTANGSLAASTLGFRGTLRYRYIGTRRSIAGSDLNTLPAFGVTDLQIARRVRLVARRNGARARRRRRIRHCRRHADRLPVSRTGLAVHRQRAGPRGRRTRDFTYTIEAWQ